MSSETVSIPGYVVGTWQIDPVHSQVGFSARHMMVSKVRGHFAKFSGTIVTAEDPAKSTVTVSVDLDSIDTGTQQRDDHLRSADFFEVTKHPQMTFASTALRPTDDGFVLDGELTLKGVTRPLSLDVEINGFGPDGFGGTRCGFSATGEINRRDFGVNFDGIQNGVVVVSDKITLDIEVEAILDTPATGS